MNLFSCHYWGEGGGGKNSHEPSYFEINTQVSLTIIHAGTHINATHISTVRCTLVIAIALLSLLAMQASLLIPVLLVRYLLSNELVIPQYNYIPHISDILDLSKALDTVTE